MRLISSHLSHSFLRLGFDILEIMVMHSIKVFWFLILNASSVRFLIIFKNGFVQNYDHGQKVRKQMRNFNSLIVTTRET